MCEFPSWIEQKDGTILFLTDKDIKHHHLEVKDSIGHSAIRKLYPGAAGMDKENFPAHPFVMKALKSGKMKGMAEYKFGPNWKNVIGVIEKASDKSLYFHATKPINLDDLQKVADAFKPFTKAKLSVETKSFTTWDAAWDAARAAARDAARDAAWDAAWAAARAAAWDAARDAAWESIADLMPTPNPFKGLTALWQAGYLVYFVGKKLIAAYVGAP